MELATFDIANDGGAIGLKSTSRLEVNENDLKNLVNIILSNIMLANIPLHKMILLLSS